MYVASIIRTRIKCEEIKLSCQKLFHCYDIFKTKKLCNCFIFSPRVFLALILRQFWDGHLYSVSYQRDRALFDSFKVPHQVVVVVAATVEARELASSFTDKCLFTTLTGQYNEINLHPSRKCTQISISSLQMTILRLCISMLCYDDTLR